MMSVAQLKSVLRKYMSFIGPGIMVSVGYMDPGNYSTAVAGGANYQYKLLFSVFTANLFAILLQSLCIKLGSVTGMDLAQMCRKSLPKWLNIIVYFFAELAIIATDLAEVVGTAIALEILFKIPLHIGVLLTVLDVLIVLLAYKPESKSMRNVRAFELFVGIFVFSTLCCFVLELFKVSIPNKWLVFEGFLPSKALTEEKGLYLSLGILGATVMPHSLYLGSSLVQSRLIDYDIKNGKKRNLNNPDKHSLASIKYCLNYSYAELIISLVLIATFLNSSILIVAGSTLFGRSDADDADLLSIYEMLSRYISPAAGMIFACAMLFSGQSAGIVCTMAGQIVSEGFLNWSVNPWLRRVITRSIAIVPCIAVTFLMGRKGIADILNFSQVILSLILPLVSAPLIYFTCSRKHMMVEVNEDDAETRLLHSDNDTDSVSPNTSLNSYGSVGDDDHQRKLVEQKYVVVDGKKYVDFSNNRLTAVLAVFTWFTIGTLNTFLVVSFFLGKDVHF